MVGRVCHTMSAHAYTRKKRNKIGSPTHHKSEFALYIARKICRLQVSSLHFYDIISDNLDEFAASYELAAAGC